MRISDWLPKFDYQMDRPPVLAEHVRSAMPNYGSATEVPRVACDAISRADFQRLYVHTRTPVILVGALKHWPAYSKWETNYLVAFAGTQSVKVTECLFLDFLLMATTKRLNKQDYWKARDQWSTEMSLADYIDVCTTNFNPERILYARDIAIPDALAGDIGDIPLFSGQMQDTTWFVGRRSYTDAHEHHGADAFACQVRGAKEFILHPPDSHHYKALHGSMSLKLWSPVRFFDVDQERFPAFADNKPVRALVEAGDALYIPDPWWHAVMSADDELDITVTKWCDPPWLNLASPQTRRQFIEAPVLAAQNAWKYGTRFS